MSRSPLLLVITDGCSFRSSFMELLAYKLNKQAPMGSPQGNPEAFLLVRGNLKLLHLWRPGLSYVSFLVFTLSKCQSLILLSYYIFPVVTEH